MTRPKPPKLLGSIVPPRDENPFSNRSLRTPKPTKAKHPFPKVVCFPTLYGPDRFITADELGEPHCCADDAAHNETDATYVAEYTLTRVLKVNRGVTFEEVK